MNDEKIKEIQQELKQLSQKQVELSKAHQQQFFLYRWLQGPDPELESVKEEIKDLKEQRRDIYKILQAAASIPPPVEEKDWSKSPLYSKTVQKLTGATTPFEQYGLYGSIIGGVYLISRSLFRSYHAMKAIDFPPDSQERLFHSFLARSTEEQLRYAKVFAHRIRTRGVLGGLLLPIGFISYIVQKHKK
jgi:hypothetical protein